MSLPRRDPRDSVIQQEFGGAKMALFVGPHLVTVLRDDFAHIPWPAHWDFPGGGRDPGESPLQCVLRETLDEVSLKVPETAIVWSRPYATGSITNWFFAAQLPAKADRDIALGSEGQRWELTSPAQYQARETAIPFLKDRLSDYLADTGQT